MKKYFPMLLLVLLGALQVHAKKPDSLDIKIGQMIMIGIEDRTGIQDGDPLIKELNEGKIGGVVVFEKNIAKTSSKDSLRSLIQRMQDETLVPLFVSIDEEGGKVHRLKEKYGFIPMPSAAYLGEINDVDSTIHYNENLAALLAELGININYAPSVDVAVNADNTVIVKNGRSFGAGSKLVSKHARACIHAHHRHGIKTVLKHFPGHGSSSGDSHFGIVDVSNSWQVNELVPYDNLVRTGDCDAIMTAHIINNRLDTSLLPATLSKTVIQGYIRGMLQFKGVIFSDDMQMDAISDHYGLENAIVMAINAGVDVLMFANTTPNKEKIVSASEVHTIIKNLVKNRKISMTRINDAYNRITALKKKAY